MYIGHQSLCDIQFAPLPYPPNLSLTAADAGS